MKQMILPALLFVALLPAMSQNKVYTVDNIPKIHLSDKTRYVCDPEHILSSQATDSIDRLLYRLEQRTSIETVVAVLPSIGNVDCFDFSHQLLNSWGVGKKDKDNGLVILLVTDQRCIHFYTGYGLEGDLPDAICKRIQVQKMIPYLKNSNWSDGMLAGVRAVYEKLDSSMPNDLKENPSDSPGVWSTILAYLLFPLAIIGFFIYIKGRKRCPKCGKSKLNLVNSRIVSIGYGVTVKENTYICKNCGYQVVRQQDLYDNRRGGFGGGFGGSRNSGGSFGGGKGGGGGAGSRF